MIHKIKTEIHGIFYIEADNTESAIQLLKSHSQEQANNFENKGGDKIYSSFFFPNILSIKAIKGVFIHNNQSSERLKTDL